MNAKQYRSALTRAYIALFAMAAEVYVIAKAPEVMIAGSIDKLVLLSLLFIVFVTVCCYNCIKAVKYRVPSLWENLIPGLLVVFSVISYKSGLYFNLEIILAVWLVCFAAIFIYQYKTVSDEAPKTAKK